MVMADKKSQQGLSTLKLLLLPDLFMSLMQLMRESGSPCYSTTLIFLESRLARGGCRKGEKRKSLEGDELVENRGSLSISTTSLIRDCRG
jgi:hypothetical protein